MQSQRSKPLTLRIMTALSAVAFLAFVGLVVVDGYREVHWWQWMIMVVAFCNTMTGLLLLRAARDRALAANAGATR